MRHQLTTQIDIEAPVETVWAVLTDLGTYAEWNPFIIEAAGSASVGSRLTNRMHPPGGKAMTFKPTVTAVKDAQTFEWLGRFGPRGVFDGRHRFDLEPTATGGTSVVQSEEFSGVLVRLMRGSLETKTAEGFEAMNHALKERAEAIAQLTS